MSYKEYTPQYSHQRYRGNHPVRIVGVFFLLMGIFTPMPFGLGLVFAIVFYMLSNYLIERDRLYQQVQNQQYAQQEARQETVQPVQTPVQQRNYQYQEPQEVQAGPVEVPVEHVQEGVTEDNAEVGVVASQKIFCTKCGQKASEGNKYCANCGTKLFYR